MTRKPTSQLLKVLLFLVLALWPAHVHAAMQTVSEGTYVDSKGAKHLWHINDSHALIWGGQPYLPAGGLFQSRYLSDSQTDANWDADLADLKSLQSHGVTDIILMASPDTGGLMKVPPEALQRVLDYLDTNGFAYGVDIGDFPRAPLVANTINPAIYRAPAPQAGGTTTFRNIAGIVSAAYFLVSTRDGGVIANGDAIVGDDYTATVALPEGMGGDGSVLLLYPKRSFSQSSLEGQHLPDIWTNSDSYRDQLLLYFSHIHFGAGLRFFVDPIVNGLGLFGDADAGMVPSSDAFRLQLRTWLLSHYAQDLGKLNTDWATKEDDLPDFGVAARCLPLWYEEKGLGILLDPDTGKQYEVDPAQSKIWADIEEFRLESLTSEMNGLADSLKNGVADVPVIYRWTQPSRLFVTLPQNDGFDGLLISTQDHGQNIAYNSAGFAYAEAEQSGRTQWLVAELAPRALAPVSALNGAADKKDAEQKGDVSPPADKSGYTSQSVFNQDQTALQDIGIKGYFVNALRRLPESAWSAVNLLDTADQLDWLHAGATQMSASADSFSTQKPSILFYPTNISLAGAGIRELGTGNWWLPTFADGQSVDMGPGLEGYLVNDASGANTYILWSPDGTVTQAVFTLPKGTKPFVTTASGAVVTVLQKKDSFTIPVYSEPVKLQGVASLPLPDGAIMASFKEAQRLLSVGESSHTPMEIFEQRVYYIENDVLGKTAASQNLAYTMLHDTIIQLSYYLSPFDWVEGEGAVSQNFGSIVSSPEASGGAYLWLDTDSPPPVDSAGSYHADYSINIVAPGDYAIWASLAPGRPGVAATSPITFSVDGGTAFNVFQTTTQGNPYGTLASAGTQTRDGQFVWCHLGSQQLTTGQHTLSITVTGTAPGTGRYTLGIDCICVTRGNFQPNGTRKPSIN